jgi:peptide/nickel transport system substrate-binding protein
MMTINRRQMLGYSASALGLAALGIPKTASAQANELVIAYNVNLPSWDPTTGPSAVNPTIQGIYQSVFDQFILQKPDLSQAPGLLTEWGFSDDLKTVHMTVREGVTWHDGSPFTAEDIVWSLQRAGDEKTGNPIQFVWKNVNNFKIDGNKITGDVVGFDPTYFKWMSFLTGYVLPKAYYEKVGAEGFEKAPIGTGPYMVEKFEQNAFVRLKANPNYWGGKPAFENVTIKFVTDAASRVAELESGSSQVTLEIPYEEYDRLIAKDGLAGTADTVSDIGMIFFNDIDVMKDKNVRQAAVLSVDKKLLVDRLLRGYGLPIDTLETPEYDAFDPSIKVEYNPEKAVELLKASGYSTDNPVKFTIQTTRGFKPKDYEMIQAIVGMWRKVGIEANIEVYEIAKHYELRAADQLTPAAFYNWGNSIGDPTTSTGFAMYGPSPHSVWDGQDVIDAINPLWGEPDQAKRIAGWKAVSKLIADEAYVLPLIQYAQPVVYSQSVKVVPHKSGALLPALMSPA